MPDYGNKIHDKYRYSNIVNDWKAAIGLQAVDGLQPSDYLYELAGKHIQGEVDIKEIQRNLKVYYESKDLRVEEESKANEADKVAANIMEVLMDNHFSLSIDEYRSIHESLFEGVFTHAGVYRLNNISKREWVLQFDSVEYGHYPEIIPLLGKAMEEESRYAYSDLSEDIQLEHFADFISRIWQIHPFFEGNTRATALFAIKYLRSMGLDVNNDVFRRYSWFFRNALARANYSNPRMNVEKDSSHLYKFFKNLLRCESHSLRNRDILILAPENWHKDTQCPNMPLDNNAKESTDEKARITHVGVYKHNDNVYSIKCSIDGVEQKGIHLNINDLMQFYKAKDAMSKEELCQFLKDLAHKYYEDKLNDKAHPKCPKR